MRTLTKCLLLCAAVAITAAKDGPGEFANDVPGKPSTVMDDVIQEPSKVMDDVIQEPSKVMDDVIRQPSNGTNDVIKKSRKVMQRNQWQACPSGWTRYGSVCFLFVQTPRTWIDAERYCNSFNGNLASVHTSAEYYFLQGEILGETNDYTVTWLGGNDAVETNVWMWSDGSRFDYTHWDSGEPNNWENRENCLHMNWGGERGWNDISCSNEYPAMCSLRLC